METPEEFRKQYYSNRKHCPKCGSMKIWQTLACPILDTRHLEDYKDTNRARCSDCGWEGIVDNLVP